MNIHRSGRFLELVGGERRLSRCKHTWKPGQTGTYKALAKAFLQLGLFQLRCGARL